MKSLSEKKKKTEKNTIVTLYLSDIVPFTVQGAHFWGGTAHSKLNFEMNVYVIKLHWLLTLFQENCYFYLFAVVFL